MEYAPLQSRNAVDMSEEDSEIHPKHPNLSDGNETLVIDHFLTEEVCDETTTNARHICSLAALGQALIDLMFTTPAIFFLVFAFLVRRHEGKNTDESPVPALQAAARYGPTIFPIAFAAVVANCLRSIAAWQLERGITVLKLEYLLGSRTVFSAVMTPLKLRSTTILAPMLIALWGFSPLGGQAALRLPGIRPTTKSTISPVYYLDVRSELQNTGVSGSMADATLPAAVGAFSAALSSPRKVKLAGQDIFGNIKIPLLEAFESPKPSGDFNGWYDIHDTADVIYVSMLGIPVKGHSPGTNTTFQMQTSYLYTTCTLRTIEGS